MIVAAERQNRIGGVLREIIAVERVLRDVVRAHIPLISTSSARITAKRVRSMVLPAKAEAGSIAGLGALECAVVSGGSSNGLGPLFGPEIGIPWAEVVPCNPMRLIGLLFNRVKLMEAEMRAARNFVNLSIKVLSIDHFFRPRNRLSVINTCLRGSWSKVEPPTKMPQNAGKRLRAAA